MPASNHPKMKSAYTLFPERVMLVPYESIVGDTPPIKSFADIDKSNSIIFNENTDEHDISISEDGIEVNNGKDSVSIQQLDQGGIGDIDDRTTSRNVSIVINTNGVNHDILAIRDGLNPLTDISNNLRFSKNGNIGGISEVKVVSEGDLDMDDVTDIVTTISSTGTGGTGFDAQVDIVNNVPVITIIDSGSGYDSAPTIEIDYNDSSYVGNAYASGNTSFSTASFNSAGNVTFTCGAETLVVALDGTEEGMELINKIEQASKDKASFPVVINLGGDGARAKSPGTTPDVTFADTDNTGLTVTDIAMEQDTSPGVDLQAVVEKGTASSAVLRSGTIVKQKWLVIMVCDISEEGGDKYYACSPRCVVSDEEDFNTSMNGEKRTNTIPLKGLKIQSEAELTTLKNAISEAITDKYNMMFTWNAGDTKYEEA